MNKKSISIKGLSVSYEKKRVLSNIYLEIEQGHVYGVIGPNGAGKSTLFKSILDLTEINAGQVRFGENTLEQVRKKIAYVPQKDEVDWQFPATVMDIVLMGRYPHKKIFQRINNEDHQIAFGALEQVGIRDLAKRQIGELSGGQQQRVFIARALCQEAEIFFLDEPFVGVDKTTEKKIIQILQDLAKQDKTLLVVHHDLSTVEKIFDKVVLLNQRLIAYGDIAEIYTKKNVDLTYAPQLSILQQTGMIE